MRSSRKLSRRSFLHRVGGGAIGGGSLLMLTGCVGISDADPYDPIGGGYGRRGGHSDSDPVDPYGQGAGGCTDSDRGRRSDPANRGRRCRQSQSDNDGGPYSDATGCGGGGCGQSYSDNDRGKYADPVGQGRRRPR